MTSRGLATAKLQKHRPFLKIPRAQLPATSCYNPGSPGPTWPSQTSWCLLRGVLQPPVSYGLTRASLSAMSHHAFVPLCEWWEVPRTIQYPSSLQSAEIFGERQKITAVLTLKSVHVVWMQYISVHKEQLGLLLKRRFSLKKKLLQKLFNVI